MAPRSSWKGFIKLSLVSVPVKAYTASVSGSEIHLNQLHALCHNRIRYKKTCPAHGDVPADEIVSGYEFAKGQYVVVEPDEISKLRLQNDRSVQIHGFIGQDQIDPLYYAGKSYYLVPDGPVGQKPYALLRQAMMDDAVHALAEIIIAGRENLVLLRPLDGLIAMSVVNWSARVKSPDAFKDEVTTTPLEKDEIKLAHTLVQASVLQDFDLSTYQDRYTAQLGRIIESKVEGKEIVAVSPPEEPQIINLMEALKASVARAQAAAPATARSRPRAAAPRSARKMAPSSRSSASRSKKKSG